MVEIISGDPSPVMSGDPSVLILDGAVAHAAYPRQRTANK
jgi:hypothetical protein